MVSVLMITYGHEKYIKQAIEGILMQECNFSIELLVADDCSPDKTESIVNQIIHNHINGDWIKYTKHKQNKGMNANFVWAAAQCKGKYIALCEGDDYWTDPCKLQRQVDLLEQNDRTSMVFSNCQVLVNGNINEINLKYPEYFSFSEYLQLYNAIPTCTMVFRRNCFDLNDKTIELLKKCPVGDFPLRFLIGDTGDFIFLSESTAVYRKHDGGVSNNFHNSKHYLGILRMYKELNAYFNYKYDHFLGIHLQDTYERLFYSYCKDKLFFLAFKTFFKACVDFDGKFLKYKRCINIFKHGVKEFIRK
jgi:glycosyltransferase involved in cell wall biosynthesis